MRPFLPADDPNPEARAKSLARDRKDYRFDTSLGGLPLAAEVPRGQGYTVRYMAEAVKVEATLTANRVGARRDDRLDDERAKYHDQLFANGFIAGMRAELADTKARGLIAAPLAFPSHLGDYDALLDVVPTPASRAHADLDAFFAWQRIAGANPAYLRRYDGQIPLDGIDVGAGDTASKAEAEGRLYVLDHSSLEGTPTRPSFGFERYVAGAVGLFVRTPAGPLMPAAIRVRSDLPVVQPGDQAWQSARNALAAADGARQGLSEHLGQCHVFANAVLLCTARELAEAHPLRILLWPHFEMTLAANETMKTAVIGADGYVDQLQGPTLDAGIEMARASCCDRSVRETSLHRDLALRGVDDTTALPEYPYRDDALLLWEAIGNWVRRYLGLYYADDRALHDDTELQAWYRALGEHLSDLPSIADRAGLVELVTIVIHRICVYHGVINYGSYDHFAWFPNLPTARWGPLDTTDLLQIVPPLGIAEHILDLMLPQRELRENTLGDYPKHHFADDRVEGYLARFQGELVSVGTRITAREQGRAFPFPYLLPSRLAQSIHV
ncbi:MAG: hypothetical protein H6737_30650 [Alphaproteobacteria bacterium]|nr:hypothetical protein [Alphaproteobacteria bacterium]